MTDVDDILTRLAVGLVEGSDQGVPLAARFCRAASTTLGCDGAAITVAYTRPERVTLCASDDTARIIEEALELMGQGPGADAFSSGAYLRLDVGGAGVDPRWPLLEDSGLSEVAPVTVHAVPLGDPPVIGVLTLYQHGAGRDFDVEDAAAVARVLAAALLADGPTHQETGGGAWSARAEVHQATGMVIAQLGVGEDDALALIRAHAYSHDQSVPRSSHDIVNRRVTFSATSDREIESS
ncbi:MAG: ANTAR domain-containing protein [Ornithinibacter sp.]